MQKLPLTHTHTNIIIVSHIKSFTEKNMPTKQSCQNKAKREREERKGSFSLNKNTLALLLSRVGEDIMSLSNLFQSLQKAIKRKKKRKLSC